MSCHNEVEWKNERTQHGYIHTICRQKQFRNWLLIMEHNFENFTLIIALFCNNLEFIISLENSLFSQQYFAPSNWLSLSELRQID